ncbi:MAG: hypothetical protein N4A41_04170 [Crocinitomicaceae bacterium]|jgi:uncharacterized membrane protein|nr:hypothetical protein [Crocinitomicaceae bacterium]
MKTTTILFLLILTHSISCTKTNFNTGIKGTVEYGQGDCMPQIDYESREYKKYKGDLYFIQKEELDNSDEQELEQLKKNSITVKIKRGKLSTELPVGTYVVMPEDVYQYSEENTIMIKTGEVLTKDFQFWKCTSY